MTDHEGRLDLSALDAGADQARADAVAASVMARIAAAERVQADELAQLRSARRWMLAAAAVLAAIATGVVVASPRRAADDLSVNLLADWAQSSHVPTNGELLATFHGYRP